MSERVMYLVASGDMFNGGVEGVPSLIPVRIVGAHAEKLVVHRADRRFVHFRAWMNPDRLSVSPAEAWQRFVNVTMQEIAQVRSELQGLELSLATARIECDRAVAAQLQRKP